MSERRLGEILRERRESLNLSIEEAAKATKLKKSTILALENGDYKELHEIVYIRGFLKVYASVLNLDYNKLSPILERELRLAGKLEEERDNRKLKPLLLLISIIVIIIVLILVIVFRHVPLGFIVRRETHTNKVEISQQIEESAKEEPQPLEKLISEEPKPKEEKVTIKETPSEAIPEKREISIEIKGLDYSWLRVIVDGNKVFEGFLNNGDFYSWKGKEKIIIRTGNAGGISITVNRKDLGILGKKGEVLEREFLPE